MPLVEQQDIIVVEGPYRDPSVTPQAAAALELRRRLESYPPVRIVSLVNGGILQGYYLPAVVEAV